MWAAAKRTDWIQMGSGKGYAHRVHQPLQCLVFITPLLLFYQIASVIRILTDLGLGERPRLLVFNKTDLLAPAEAARLAREHAAVPVSAHDARTLPAVREAIRAELWKNAERARELAH